MPMMLKMMKLMKLKQKRLHMYSLLETMMHLLQCTCIEFCKEWMMLPMLVRKRLMLSYLACLSKADVNLRYPYRVGPE